MDSALSGFQNLISVSDGKRRVGSNQSLNLLACPSNCCFARFWCVAGTARYRFKPKSYTGYTYMYSCNGNALCEERRRVEVHEITNSHLVNCHLVKFLIPLGGSRMQKDPLLDYA